VPTPPPRTDEQLAAALAKAQQARQVRAALKAALQKGELGLPDVWERAETDPVVANTKLLTILESLPRLGKVRSRRLLEELKISERQRVRGVGPNQRQRLNDHFEEKSR
jgi:S13-like H2TH domain